jgi:hypothetical protein
MSDLQTEEKMKTPLFELGMVVMTVRALAAFADTQADPQEYLWRHVTGDWGLVDSDDQKTNDLSLVYGERLLSAYVLPDGTRFWVITEADRSATTFLLPEDY